ncbi:MAG: hypothetical protein BWY06_02829 [Candidatus Latescibacteria bacterium ADurb.Bin168]|nr:MAG: hypothetical protein BWY06_02829 [Candidatus Latescibacteria bacterium ADurb.Bin168]
MAVSAIALAKSATRKSTSVVSLNVMTFSVAEAVPFEMSTRAMPPNWFPSGYKTFSAWVPTNANHPSSAEEWNVTDGGAEGVLS